MLLQRLYLFAALGVFVHASSYTSNQAVVSKSEAPAALTDWLVIGPFQIGTRGTHFRSESGPFANGDMQRLLGAQTRLRNMEVSRTFLTMQTTALGAR